MWQKALSQLQVVSAVLRWKHLVVPESALPISISATLSSWAVSGVRFLNSMLLHQLVLGRIHNTDQDRGPFLLKLNYSKHENSISICGHPFRTQNGKTAVEEAASVFLLWRESRPNAAQAGCSVSNLSVPKLLSLVFPSRIRSGTFQGAIGVN